MTTTELKTLKLQNDEPISGDEKACPDCGEETAGDLCPSCKPAGEDKDSSDLPEEEIE